MTTLSKSKYKHLANAVILQAVSDYRKSLRGERAYLHMSVEDMKKDCERFFQSEWFSILTKIDGRQLMRKLQEEYYNESNSYPKYKSPNRNNL